MASLNHLSGPLAPQQLYQILIKGDYRQAQCVDAATKVKQQKEVLIELILEYERQVEKAYLVAQEVEKFTRMKQAVLEEIEVAKCERAAIGVKVSEDLQLMRDNPIQTRQKAKEIHQIDEVRARNQRLRVRIRDAEDYLMRVQVQNRRLQEERGIIAARSVEGKEWQMRLDALRRQNLSYERGHRGERVYYE